MADRRSIFHDPEDEAFPGLRVNPIGQEAARVRPLLPLGLAAVVTVLVLIGLVNVDLGSLEAIRQRLDQPVPVTIALDGLAEDRPGRDEEHGRGHVEGTNTIDPRLLSVPALPPQREVAALRPEDAILQPGEILPGAPVAGLRKDLPVAPGGNGLLRGTGRDSSMGASGKPAPAPPGLLEKIYPTYTVRVRLPDKARTGQPVSVDVLVDEAGEVLSARAISGEQAAWKECEAAARKWRFFIPSRLAAFCPLILHIQFRVEDK